MKFSEAVEIMKRGGIVKLPEWRGYWEMEVIQGSATVIMHCHDGRSMDIRNCDDVLFTLLNVASDQWETATTKNCPVLRGEFDFDFSEALRQLKKGKAVCRKGWNGKGQYIELASNLSYKNSQGEVVNADHDAIGSEAIAFVGTSGTQIGWLASQADLLAKDWTFAHNAFICPTCCP